MPVLAGGYKQKAKSAVWRCFLVMHIDLKVEECETFNGTRHVGRQGFVSHSNVAAESVNNNSINNNNWEPAAKRKIAG